MAKKKVTQKLMKAKKVAPQVKKAAGTVAPTLVITVQADCTLSNNQNLSPPHLSKSTGGGFPHQVKFKAETETWVCLPANGFENAPNQIHIKAGGNAGPYKVKANAPMGMIYFSHSCAGPCGPGGGGGDPIIIDP